MVTKNAVFMRSVAFRKRLYNPKTKRYEYHYKDCFGKERVISSYRLEMTDGVYESFQRIIENRYLKGDIEPVCYDEQGNAN